MAISVRKDNPFTTGYVINYTQGDASLERTPIVYVPSVNDRLHVVKKYDTLWDLSFDYYGNSKYWWVLADINDIINPFELTSNTNLIIPDIARINILL